MSANKSFVSNQIFLQVLNWLIKPVWIFLIDREVQNLLGEEVYGNYFFYLNTSLILMLLLDFGMHNFNAKEVGFNKRFLKIGTPGLAWLKLCMSILYFTLLYFLGLNSIFLLAIGLNQVLSSWILFYRTSLSGLHLFKFDAIFSVLDRLLAVLLLSLFLFSTVLRPFFTIQTFVYLQTIAFVISLCILLFVSKQKNALYIFQKPSISKLKKLFISNLPFAMLTLLMTFYMRFDAIYINLFSESSDLQTGLYAQGFRMLEALSMYAMMFTGMLLPLFSRQISQQEESSGLLNLVLKFVWIPAFFMVVLAVFKSKEVMELLYNYTDSENHKQASETFKALMFAFVPMSGSLVLGTYLTAASKLKQLIWSSFFAFLTLSLFSMVFISKIGSLGAAYSVFAAQMVVFICFVYVYISFKKEKLVHFILSQKQILLFGGLLYTINKVLWGVFNVGFLNFIVINILLIVLLVIVLKMFNLANLKKILKDRIKTI